jgi:hypothetical protein
LTGCKSVEENIQTNEINLKDVWKSSLVKLQSGEEEKIDWDEALEILLESNIDIASANLDIYKAENELKFVYRDLIPTLTLKGGYADFLGGTQTVFASGWTYGIDTFFNFAYLKEIPTRLYTSRLGLLRAETGKKLKKRQVVIDLYKIFKEANLMVKEEEYLLWKENFKRKLPIEDLGSILFYNKERTAEKAFEEKTRELQLRLNDILSDSARIWVIDHGKLPTLPYLSKGGVDLENIAQLGQDQIKLLAIELEGARLRGKQIDLKYWPDMNISISTPSLFEFSNQSQSVWSTENIRAGADIAWKIDTRLQIKREKDEYLKEREIQDQLLEKKIITWIIQLTKVNERLNIVRKEYDLQHKRWEIFNNLSVPRSMEAFNERMQLLDQWWQRNQTLEKEMLELETTLWFFDDTQWEFLEELG